MTQKTTNQDLSRIIEKLKKHSDFKVIIPTDKDNKNSIGIEHSIIAEIFPKDTTHILQIVDFARKHKIPLYPISTGLNIGYGDKSPWQDKHILVNMCEMNKILSFDNNLGIVRIEPGVTQQQLFDYLEKNHSNYWMDVTGAGPRASIIGNILDGGFGHTPIGYKRKSCSNFEVVLGTGEIINTETFPTIGPDLSSLFIQSNFGIVTSLELELFKKSNSVEMVMFSGKNKEDFTTLLEIISELRAKDIINNLAHIYNPLRLLISLGITTKKEANYLSNNEAYLLLKKHMPNLGYWNCSAALYGSKAEIKNKKKEIKKLITKKIKVNFFNKRKIGFLSKILKLGVLSKFKFIDKANKAIENLSKALEVFKGKAFDNNVQNNHLSWKQESSANGGLIWYAPTLKTDPEEICNFYNEAELLFENKGFDFPLTLTLVTKQRSAIIISIHYNKNNKNEVKKATQFYKELESHFANKNILPYRCPIISDLQYLKNSSRYNSLRKIKAIFDPDNIIAQKRYIEF